MSFLKKNYFRIFVLIFLLTWLGIFLFQKIDLTTADLGRHLKNGELILKGNFEVLKSNLYSFTYPDYPFINHHWLGGVIFYLIGKVSGFSGIHLFYLILTLITFLIFFRLAEKQSNTQIAAILALILIPLIAQREEIRPEIFSYFFGAIFFLILAYHRKRVLSSKYLFLLPILMTLWVNLHIYFILGLGLIGLFFLEEMIFSRSKKKEILKNLGVVFFLSLVFSLVNPFGPKAVIYPFKVFEGYGYRIIENQSIWFLEKLGFIKNPNFTLFKIAFLALLASFILVFVKNRRNFSLINFSLAMVFGAMAALAIRNFTIFGFFALPILAENIKIVFGQKIQGLENKEVLILGLVIFIVLFSLYAQELPLQGNKFGLGLMPGVEAAAEFFKTEDLQGPIFNNYDIGGYLIYFLFPKEKVFVDNRPEAYPAYFFKEKYIPLQENEEIWQREQKNYSFNTIFFSHRDLTPWAQKFLINRVNDSFWAPVFADQHNIIFLKRNSLNKNTIEKYEIPRDYFKITQKQ